MFPDVKLGVKLAEEGTIELDFVVCHQYLRNSKPTSNGFPNKSLHFGLPNLSQGLSLGPFSEIINSYDYKLFVGSGH